MNGSDDEQHDAHFKCYRIAFAVAGGDAVEAAYDKHPWKAGSTDSAIIELRRARQQRGERRAADLSSPELLLAPVESWLGTSPIQAKRRRIRRRRHDRGRPQNPMPGSVSTR
jgi:hypothetical protein